MTVFFYDSYAVIEYLKDNPQFVPYFEHHLGILTLLNILEVYYSVLHDAGEEKASTVLETLYSLVVYPTQNTIKEAMKFRLHHRKRNLSYADCLGYQIAKERGILFLTGDIQFQDLPNVEFVH